MSAEDFLIQSASRHQVFIERYGAGQANEAKKLLNRLRRDIVTRLAQEPTQFRAERLNALRVSLDELYTQMFGEITVTIKRNSLDFAVQESEFAARMLDSVTKDNPDFILPSSEQLATALRVKPMNIKLANSSVTIDQALTSFAKNKSKEITQLINDSIVLGDTTPEISKKVSELMNVKQSREISSLTRTIINHSSSQARNLTYEANSDILDGYEWVSTLDSRTSLVCSGRDGKVYDVGSGPMPPAHFNCVLGDTLITSAFGVSAVFKRVFKGEVITINTVSGNKLTVTPNHPILTSKGWTPAKLLNVGDKCINQSRCKGVGSVNSDDNGPFKTAEDIFKSFSRSSGVSSSKVEISTPDFHGDGINNEVAQVWSAGDLSGVADFGITKGIGNSILSWRDMMKVNPTVESIGSFDFLLNWDDSTCHGDICSFSNSFSLLRGGHIHSSLLLLAPVSDIYPVFSEDALYRTWTDAEQIRNSPDTYSGGVFLDDIISVDIGDFSGHVYNLQTLDHCYSANGIITHNCRSTTIPVVKDEFTVVKLKGMRPQVGDTVGRTSAKTTYGGWLKKQSKAFQDEALGPERASLFRTGKLKIEQFTDELSGETISLAGLKARYPIAFGE